MSGSNPLLAGAVLSFAAAMLHVAVIIGGADWYRFFGAGEDMARLAESGSSYPAMVTAAIAAVLCMWGLYALSGAGVILRLPLLKTALCAITFVYLIRGVAGFAAPFFTDHPAVAQNSVTFWMLSSAICCAIGTFHLLGVINRWGYL